MVGRRWRLCKGTKGSVLIAELVDRPKGSGEAVGPIEGGVLQ